VGRQQELNKLQHIFKKRQIKRFI